MLRLSHKHSPFPSGIRCFPLWQLLMAQQKDLGHLWVIQSLPIWLQGEESASVSPPTPCYTESSLCDECCTVSEVASRPYSLHTSPSFLNRKSACNGVVHKKWVEFKHKWNHSVFILNCHLPIPQEFRIQRSFQALTFRTGRERHLQRHLQLNVPWVFVRTPALGVLQRSLRKVFGRNFTNSCPWVPSADSQRIWDLKLFWLLNQM